MRPALRRLSIDAMPVARTQKMTGMTIIFTSAMK
jgi:hypothetical protein